MCLLSQKQSTAWTADLRRAWQTESGSVFRHGKAWKEPWRTTGEDFEAYPRICTVPSPVCQPRNGTVGECFRRRGITDVGFVACRPCRRTGAWCPRDGRRFTPFRCPFSSHCHPSPAARWQPGRRPSDAYAESTPTTETRQPRYPQRASDVRQPVRR